MKRAMEAVKNGELGVNCSALLHGVPRTTLKDRIAGRIKHGTKPGLVAYLDAKEEEEVVNFYLNAPEWGTERQSGRCSKSLRKQQGKKGSP